MPMNIRCNTSDFLLLLIKIVHHDNAGSAVQELVHSAMIGWNVHAMGIRAVNHRLAVDLQLNMVLAHGFTAILGLPVYTVLAEALHLVAVVGDDRPACSKTKQTQR